MSSESSLLEAVARWPIDARDEPDVDYFVKFRGVSSIEDGQTCFVIGRKGSGKTAIAEYIRAKPPIDSKCRILSFNSFPFNLLYEQKDKAYRGSSSYITIWKYVIYTAVCSEMIEDGSVSEEQRERLARIFQLDFDAALGKSIRRITERTFGASLLGSGLNVQKAEQLEAPPSLMERMEALEDLIKQHAGNAKYFVLFDALDDDYSYIFEEDSSFNEYKNLLTSLFKAVLEVKHVFRGSGVDVFPVVFLRDDIFGLLESNDKNKWNDKLITLNWSKESLTDLVTRRLETAAAGVSTLGHDHASTAAELFFENITRVYAVRGKVREVSIIEYMLRSTLLRPRDIIMFFREVARHCLRQSLDKADVDAIKAAEHKYSDYLRQEIENELHPILADIRRILDAIANIRKEIFSPEEFYNKLTAGNGFDYEKSPLNFRQIVEILYKFGVLGNITRTGAYRMFSYESNRKDVDHQENLCIHRGLIRSLQVVNTRDLLVAEE